MLGPSSGWTPGLDTASWPMGAARSTSTMCSAADSIIGADVWMVISDSTMSSHAVPTEIECGSTPMR
ncbi:hypothetical protein K353_06570 [Kitasatospora sp. SolWspMP-SS2h]|nr:hypothetical protein K353_06570 [Kitasatospora sp. SolWspMP-SS2h]